MRNRPARLVRIATRAAHAPLAAALAALGALGALAAAPALGASPTPTAPAAAPASPAAPALAAPQGAWPANPPRPSAALERMLRDRLAEGIAVPGWAVTRFRLDEPEWEAPAVHAPSDATAAPSLRAVRPGTLGLGADVLVNDKAPDAGSCSGCAFRPLSQAETTVAAWGDYVTAGWNNSRGFCGSGAVQGYGYSSDGGLTWTDGGDPPALPGGGRYRGDPVHAVNRATGRFYIAGLYEGGALGSGLAVCRGTFSGSAFTIDLNRQVAVGGADFLDKEWMAVDSLSGNVYVSWTPFTAVDNRIDFQRFDADLNPLGPPVALNAPASNGLVQASRPVVGPDGVVYVTWYEYGFPLSAMKIRRSLDLGATFGPEATIATFYENGYNGAPGYRRGFAPTFPSIAVDESDGPHRGRIYVAWDEAPNFYDAPLNTAGAQVESENNGFFASANPIDPGALLRGALSSTGDVEMFRFDGVRGRTYVFRCDSLGANMGLNLRVICSSDTASSDTWRILAYNTGGFPAACWTCPADGVYYLRLAGTAGSATGPWTLSTGLDTPSAGERARHNRDKFLAWSDDGTVWSDPLRLNDNPPWSDGIFPEVAVDGLGRVHAYWHDFRDDPACGAESFEYMTSSGDGGLSWGANRALSDAASFWSFNACGSANQGDYQGIAADGDRVFPVWADSRLGDADVWAEGTRLASQVACPGPATLVAGADTTLEFRLTNLGNVTSEFAWSAAAPATWNPVFDPAAQGVVSLGASGGIATVRVTITAPSDCNGTPAEVRVVWNDASISGAFDTCVVAVSCVPNVGVPAASIARLDLSAPRPNPSRGTVDLSYALPRAGRARLTIYGASGRRVRTLADGEAAAGDHAVRWDGRDAAGRRVAPGVYVARLETPDGTRERTVVRVH